MPQCQDFNISAWHEDWPNILAAKSIVVAYNDRFDMGAKEARLFR
jgi:hypothetical protein